MQPIITITGLTAGYDGKPQIKGVNIEICAREFVGITGPNGGGKTTLLKAMLGLLRPMAGSVIYHGKPKIGYLPQYNASDKQFPISVGDTVMSGLNGELGILGKFTERHRSMLNDILQRFMLTDLAARPLKALSGGQLQRVFMARAIISRPDIILLDEPHTYIDEAFESEMNKILCEERQRSTIIMVSHNMEYIKETATKIIHVDETATILS